MGFSLFSDKPIYIYIYTHCMFLYYVHSWSSLFQTLSDSFTTWMNSNNLSSDRRSKPDPYGCLSQNCWPPNVMIDRRVPHWNSDVVVSFGTHNWRLAAWFCHYVPMICALTPVCWWNPCNISPSFFPMEKPEVIPVRKLPFLGTSGKGDILKEWTTLW